jgi:hypothetical protein
MTVLKFIFNLNPSQNTFPNLWKQAAIFPVFRIGKTSSVENYRPIAILNNFSNVSKFIIHDHVPHFLKSKLNSSQHGFIKSKSTVTNLVTFLHFVTPLVCSQGQTDSIYFDFINSFNILPHALLHHKLSNYGLYSGYLNWFLSYLTNRQSCVRYSGILSTPSEVQSGVPQGSVSGPSLFNIYKNDFCDIIKHSNCLLFADDLKVCRAVSSPSDCLLQQSDINRVRNWWMANFMKPNFSKI